MNRIHNDSNNLVDVKLPVGGSVSNCLCYLDGSGEYKIRTSSTQPIHGIITLVYNNKCTMMVGNGITKRQSGGGSVSASGNVIFEVITSPSTVNVFGTGKKIGYVVGGSWGEQEDDEVQITCFDTQNGNTIKKCGGVVLNSTDEVLTADSLSSNTTAPANTTGTEAQSIRKFVAGFRQKSGCHDEIYTKYSPFYTTPSGEVYAEGDGVYPLSNSVNDEVVMKDSVTGQLKRDPKKPVIHLAQAYFNAAPGLTPNSVNIFNNVWSTSYTNSSAVAQKVRIKLNVEIYHQNIVGTNIMSGSGIYSYLNSSVANQSGQTQDTVATYENKIATFTAGNVNPHRIHGNHDFEIILNAGATVTFSINAWFSHNNMSLVSNEAYWFLNNGYIEVENQF